MPNVKANGIQIEYDTFGDSSSPPLLLNAGIGSQLISMFEGFCKLLAEKGYYIIRYDYRDVGLSTKFDDAGVPDVMAAITASMQGQEVQAPYTFEDMADDAVGLLDALGIEKAHIYGISMGAAITQVISYRHPSRVLTLISIMGTTGNPDLPRAKPEILQLLITPSPREREAYIENAVNTFKAFSGKLKFDEELYRQRATDEYDNL